MDVRQLHGQHGSLQAVHSTVYAFHLVLVLAYCPVIGIHADPRGQLIVIRDYSTGVTVGTQVLARIEAERARHPERPDRLTAKLREMGLRTILDKVK